MAKYTHKGSQIAVEGSIKTDSWEDERGEKRYKTYVLARRIMFLDSKRTEEPFPQEPDYINTQVKQQEKNDPFEEFGKTLTITEDDLPF